MASVKKISETAIGTMCLILAKMRMVNGSNVNEVDSS